jgi:hypothetical protein
MNGYTTIGITPELAAMMEQEWSEPVQVRARRGANGALELEFREAFATAPVSTEPGCLHPKCVLDHPHSGPAVLAKPKGATRATDH